MTPHSLGPPLLPSRAGVLQALQQKGLHELRRDRQAFAAPAQGAALTWKELGDRGRAGWGRAGENAPDTRGKNPRGRGSRVQESGGSPLYGGEVTPAKGEAARVAAPDCPILCRFGARGPRRGWTFGSRTPLCLRLPEEFDLHVAGAARGLMAVGLSASFCFNLER